MKIGILTQPLGHNYGGILQAYALQTVLRRMGHTPVNLSRLKPRAPLLPQAISYAKWLILRYVFRRNDIQPRCTWPSDIARHMAEQTRQTRQTRLLRRFVGLNIAATRSLRCTRTLQTAVQLADFQALVVGSDQVWRPYYSPCIENYFLDFLPDDSPITRIAYAASFGVAEWEFTAEQTTRCATLAQDFDAVSVREDSGVRMCRERLQVDASHVLDPTMLLSKEDYLDLIGPRQDAPPANELFVYLLDMSEDKRTTVECVAQHLGLVPRYFIQDYEAPYPPVEAWLQGFATAKFVVTDSFHGCVFSILFGKPFLLYNNHSRGLARFDSLFHQFNLESLRVENSAQIQLESLGKINWDTVGARMSEWQNASRRFLTTSLERPHAKRHGH